MNRASTFTLAAVLFSVALVPHGAIAAGTSARAWVSVAKGNDTAGCGAATVPCRTFQYAFTNVVASGGSILVLDPGGYGSINITNPISIINEGGVAGIFAANATGNAIDINLPAGGKVTLKGLTIDGAATGVHGSGVDMRSAGTLTMMGCTVTGFTSGGDNSTGNGVFVRPASGTAKLHIAESNLSGNAQVGVFIIPNYTTGVGATSAVGTIRNVAMNDNSYGFFANGTSTTGTIKVAIEDSVASQNGNGIFVFGANAAIRINRVNATQNTTADLTGSPITLGTNLYDTFNGVTVGSLH